MKYPDRSLSGLQFHFIGSDECSGLFTPLNRSFTVIRLTKLVQIDEVYSWNISKGADPESKCENAFSFYTHLLESL